VFLSTYRFWFCHVLITGETGTAHILCYFIPGPGAATEPGRRGLNWVWYVNMPDGPELERLLTDRTGKLHGASVPAGMVPAQLTAEVHAAAARELHPRFVELVQGTADPFIQTILDVVVPRMTFGRACLLGDAAFVLRPHAAAATAKAAADATTMAASLAANPGDPDAAMRSWETRQLEHGRSRGLWRRPREPLGRAPRRLSSTHAHVARRDRALRRDRPTTEARVKPADRCRALSCGWSERLYAALVALLFALSERFSCWGTYPQRVRSCPSLPLNHSTP
jgi:2-polyprenyl-6-methoxyphenol hydroxylase-like FAD-dependent oxidoreductase